MSVCAIVPSKRVANLQHPLSISKPVDEVMILETPQQLKVKAMKS